MLKLCPFFVLAVDLPIPKTVNVRARNRWYLIYTLVQNNRLLAERFDAILNAKRNEVKRQIEEDKQKKDENIVKDAVKTFVKDDVTSNDEVGEEVRTSGCDDGGDVVEVASVNSSNFKLQDNRRDDERLVLLANTPANARTSYNAIHPKLKV